MNFGQNSLDRKITIASSTLDQVNALRIGHSKTVELNATFKLEKTFKIASLNFSIQFINV